MNLEERGCVMATGAMVKLNSVLCFSFAHSLPFLHTNKFIQISTLPPPPPQNSTKIQIFITNNNLLVHPPLPSASPSPHSTKIPTQRPTPPLPPNPCVVRAEIVGGGQPTPKPLALWEQVPVDVRKEVLLDQIVEAARLVSS